MDIGVIGINFRLAQLEIREKLAKHIQSWQTNSSIEPMSVVFLSTCNRFEVYFSAKDLTEAHTHLMEQFKRLISFEEGYLMYSYFGRECFFHLTKVTSGFDSAIIAESEIQGQVKKAYLKACNTKLSKSLHYAFQKSLKLGKEIRPIIPKKERWPDLTQTVSKMLLSLKEIYKDPKILFVGTSKINTQIIRSLNGENLKLFVTSHSLKRAETYAQKYSMEVLPFEQLKNWNHYQGLCFATEDPNTLIDLPDHLNEEKKIVIDLSVPRNVPSKIGLLENIQLINIDQLNKLIRRYRKVKHKELKKIDFLIQKAVFTQWALYRHREYKKESYLSAV